MEPIVKFVECLLPVTACNLKCSYCYVIQEDRRKLQIPDLDFSLDTIQYALRKERFGGTCYFSICGAGETLIPSYMPELAARILANGHYVNITTNGTITKRFDELLSRLTDKEKEKLHFAFSLHYVELKRLNLLETFFANVNKVRGEGCSVVVQLNMCDEYMPLIDEIKEVCMNHIGALPQIAVTRKEESFPVKHVSLHTEGSQEDYIKAGQEFDSPLFEFTLKNFLVKRKEFCYAGEWTYQLNLQTGMMKRCYNSCVFQNIFKHPDAPIMHVAVGRACNSPYCFNSSHFMSQGVIPEIECPSYQALRDRPEARWYNDTMKQALSGKLYETNKEYGVWGKIKSTAFGIVDKPLYKLYSFYLSVKKK